MLITNTKYKCNLKFVQFSITKNSDLSINLSEVLKFMDKYKINYIFSEKKDINEIFIKVLNIELKKYIGMICKTKKSELPPSFTYLSLEGGKNC